MGYEQGTNSCHSELWKTETQGMPKDSLCKLSFIFHAVLSVSSLKLHLKVDEALS